MGPAGQPEAAAGQWALLLSSLPGAQVLPQGLQEDGSVPSQEVEVPSESLAQTSLCCHVTAAGTDFPPVPWDSGTAWGWGRSVFLRDGGGLVLEPHSVGCGSRTSCRRWGWGSSTARGGLEQALWAPSPPAWVRLHSTPSHHRCFLPAGAGSAGGCSTCPCAPHRPPLLVPGVWPRADRPARPAAGWR